MIFMAAPDKTDETPLPEQARALLDAVKAARGVWLSRQDIAHTMGKNRLNPGDTAMLEMLTAQGLIEAQERPTSAPSGYRWEYRAK